MVVAEVEGGEGGEREPGKLVRMKSESESWKVLVKVLWPEGFGQYEQSHIIYW